MIIKLMVTPPLRRFEGTQDKDEFTVRLSGLAAFTEYRFTSP